ncbi:MAG TPA: VWA domain-containing protein [Verrucomicrobiae bacterium]|nr:VWA domain-containing protein [Verrucomicrobiae bacterium]
MMKLWVLCLILAASAAAEDQTPVFTARSELVLVDVQVLNVKNGGPAPKLSASDLMVTEEGVPQTITLFSRDEFPLSVVLLFDLTDSVRGVLKHLAEGARIALSHFKPEDEVSVMVYSGGATLVDGFTRNRDRTLQAVGRAANMTSDQPAHFNEGVYQAVMQLRNANSPANRRVIIWLTDNIPNVPFRKMDWPVHTEIEAFRVLHEDGVVVAPILMKSAAWAVFAPFIEASEASKRKDFPPGDAKKYAELTGGQAVGMRGKKPEERLMQLIDELRARYTIGYRPAEEQPAGTFRRIKVILSPHGLLRPKEWTVLAREGYYRK